MVRVIRRRSRSTIPAEALESLHPSQLSLPNCGHESRSARESFTASEHAISPSKALPTGSAKSTDPDSQSYSSLPNNDQPSMSGSVVESLQYADAASKPSLLSSIRGRTAMLRTWVMANPLVTSSFEDMDKGIAKQTRSNTLINRQITSKSKLEKNSIYSVESDLSDSSSRIPMLCSSTSSCSSASSDTSSTSRRLCFSEKVKAYYSNSRVVEETIKAPNKRPPLEVRLARSRMTYPVDPSQPLSAGGKWLQQRSK